MTELTALNENLVGEIIFLAGFFTAMWLSMAIDNLFAEIKKKLKPPQRVFRFYDWAMDSEFKSSLSQTEKAQPR